MTHLVPYRRDPLGPPRNPLVIFLLLLALTSGLSTLFGPTVARSVEHALEPWVQNVWGVLLTVGAGTTLAGMWWPLPGTGILLKRTGMLALSVAAVLYAAILLTAFGTPALLSAGTTFGFGLACAFQYRDLNRHVHVVLTEGVGE